MKKKLIAILTKAISLNYISTLVMKWNAQDVIRYSPLSSCINKSANSESLGICYTPVEESISLKWHMDNPLNIPTYKKTHYAIKHLT